MTSSLNRIPWVHPRRREQRGKKFGIVKVEIRAMQRKRFVTRSGEYSALIEFSAKLNIEYYWH